ncbi:MAG: PSD1 and planctomycete cytochrome C domain-containing protein [Planctomycetota bacterium]|nr:PSD1 and planctomycete cytochrome C domain-containing protein [Planctomycetota bacterium]
MHNPSSFFLAPGWVLVLIAHPASGQDAIDFNRDIRPILSDNCFACHGPDEKSREADLRLDGEQSAKADRGGDRVIRPGQPEQSLLVDRIFSPEADELMPPPDSGKQLTEKEKKLLSDWIRKGAPWSRHWAYVPPRKTAAPEVDSDWPRTWIDRFIFSKLAERDLMPVDDADKVSLIRRLHFDLVGLPPSEEEVDQFLNDRSADAVKRVTQRLLASKHFGERMAIYWLDLVRYADTVGYHGDQDHNISPYRDWVIGAFNSNMPFDRFTRSQLAGDLLPDGGQEDLIASGYNRLLQTTHEGGLQAAEYRAMYAADRVRNVSAVWMGGTVGCAQCHDHKYDPYTSRDFYALSAFFADIDDEEHFRSGTNSLPTRRNPEIPVLDPRKQKQITQWKSDLQKLETRKKSTTDSAELKAVQDQAKQVADRIAEVEKSGRFTMITKALKEPRVTRILPRGNFLDASGPIVQPLVPSFLMDLGSLDQDRRLNRLDLADWLTNSRNPSGLLTSRVFVNRMWYLFFGRGLAPDLNDFGGQGEPPDHPELLDQLAIAFVEHDWNVKWLIEEIVSSRAYRLSSIPSARLIEKDPENRFFARQSRYRLPAELVRDNALSISGLLVEKKGGISIKPYQPAGYYRHLNFPQRKYSSDADERQYQRGVYIHWQRQFLHPMLKAFDAPRREECTAERSSSNTPSAALVLLNDPTFVESARVFAERIVARQLSPGDSLRTAVRVALSREAGDNEIQLLGELFEMNLALYRSDEVAARRLLAVGLKKPDEQLDIATLAAMTQVARAIFNLDEFVTRR